MKYVLLIVLALNFTHSIAQERTVAYVTSFDGVQITYDVHSNPALKPDSMRATVVLVHGWSCDRTYWSEQTSALAKKYQVVAIDLAGHGGSGTQRRVYSMESFGEDVAAVVNKLGLHKVILVGHSMGGDVIAEAARILRLQETGNREPEPGNKPTLVAGLIMVDTYKKLGAGRTPEEVEAIVSRVRDHFKDSTKVLVKGMFIPSSNPTLVEEISTDMSSASPRIALSAMEHALSYSRQMPKTLLELKLPVIEINPDNSPTDMASMKKYSVEVMVMKGVGHFLMREDPVGFNKIFGVAIGKLAK